ncbi:enoyl-CoA hydratase-related protein [Aneurinibacillus sp. Ricciae_BoGa-3]|uniref:enoyl-CoA hydratase/isomerase family protein n=1 Tax=Aneurinibacillus sp. Ricciae_BoGa-3 TaxID=3022697 RepID=UPI0023422E2C|nr:enoyl-CoA hydratase-related protein [Aneurinibacillus sp. Ricciae_BoGa-3]WCK55572.1 enoyl-CoA hydratase-related protein [Aneurinibacillus sp. Ricciae_BoGa-3]
MAQVTWQLENNIGIITIDSPPVNALNQEVLAQLSEIVDGITDDVKAVIVTGAGEKAFVAGADIKEFPQMKQQEGEALCHNGQAIFNKIAALKQPVIAAVNGFALGGGLELALACDFRVASPKAKLGLPEVNLGVIPGYGGTQRLARLIGPGKAKQLIFSAEMVTAEEAYRIGLVESITDGSALDEAKAWAGKIIKRGPLAVQAAKQAVDKGLEMHLADGLKLEAKLFGEICGTEDKNEGVAAFFEKREPVFRSK